MDRRRFLQSSLAFTGAMLTASCSYHKLVSSGPQRFRVVIVGAGLSGLATAYELERLGYDVVVLEATNRVGGRVLTERKGFLENQFTEQGATLIPSHHRLVLDYVREFNLKLSPFNSFDTSTLFHFGGKSYVESAANKKTYPASWQLTEEEDENGLEWIEEAYFHRGFSRIGNPLDSGWAERRETRDLDALSYKQYLQQSGASKTAIDIELAVEGSGGNKNSAAIWIAQAYLDQNLERFFQIAGGNDSLPEGFAARLQSKPRLNSFVTEIDRGDHATKVRYLQNGVAQEVFADAVVFTGSPALLKKIRFTKALSAQKQKAVQSVAMAPVTKVSMAMKERFWKKIPTDSIFVAYTDQIIERVWDISVNQPGNAGLLIGYAQEDHAKTLSAFSQDQQLQKTIEIMENFMPGTKKNFAQGSAFSWHEQDWVGGAWVSYVTNQLPLLKELGRTENNLFFAGDHTSLRNAWMQGALESAHRVVGEITALAKRATV